MPLVDIIGLYDGTALNGSYAGIGFAFASGSDDPGRRVQAFLSPGQDVKRFQDLGQDDGEIVFSGKLVGDDYVRQADRLKAAFQTPGPATLVSPWWGTIQVMQAPDKRPKFDYSEEHLRVVTFTATVLRYFPAQPPPADTLQDLLDAVADLKTAVLGLLSAVLAPIALVLSTIAAVESLAGEVASALGGLIAAASDPLVGIAGALPIGLLADIGSIPPDMNYGPSVYNFLAAPSAAIAGTTTPAIPAAVAPGDVITTDAPVDGRITAQLLLSAAAALPSVGSAPAAVPGMTIAMTAILLSDAMTAASDIAFDSQQEAATWRDSIAAALDAASVAAAAQVQANATAAATLWRALTAARAAWLADMSITIGRLPPVITLTPPGQFPVWLITYYQYGADPRHMVSGYLDIVSRNGIRHPAIPPAGPLEVLA